MILGLSLLSVVLLFIRTMAYFVSSHITARSLHNQMFNALLRAPVFFFDSNPIGKRISELNIQKDVLRFQVVLSIVSPKMFHLLMNNYQM